MQSKKIAVSESLRDCNFLQGKIPVIIFGKIHSQGLWGYPAQGIIAESPTVIRLISNAALFADDRAGFRRSGKAAIGAAGLYMFAKKHRTCLHNQNVPPHYNLQSLNVQA
jgi:hypothetical protein